MSRAKRLADLRLGDAAKKVGSGIVVAIVIGVAVLFWLGIPKAVLEGRYCDDYLEAYDGGNVADPAGMVVAIEKIAGLRNTDLFGIIEGRSSKATVTAVSIVDATNAAPTPTDEEIFAVFGMLESLAKECR